MTDETDQPESRSHRNLFIALILATVFAVLLIVQLRPTESDRLDDQSECRWATAIDPDLPDCD